MYIYDLLAILLISICHIFLYVKLIRYDKLSFKMLSLMSVIFAVLLIIVISITKITQFNALFLLIFLLAFGLLQQKRGLSFAKSLFFALISSVVITISRMVLIEILFFLFMKSPFNLYRWTYSVLHLIAVFIIFLIIIIWFKKITRVIHFIVTSRLYYFTYSLLIVTFLILFALTSLISNPLNITQMNYGKMSYLISIVFFLLLLIVFIISSHLSKEQLIEQTEEQLDEALLNYIEKLEVLHDELASFRHDYMNVLLSLDYAIRSEDIDQIKQTYYETIAPTSKFIYDQELELIKLSQISISEVKSILTVKTIEAHQQQIDVYLDIPHEINNIAMPIISFIRAISILIDNAIEEVKQSDKKELFIALFETKNEQYVVVKNYTKRKLTDLQTIYHRHISHKGEKRGYGLFSLKRLIEENRHVALDTTYRNGIFAQTLILKKDHL